MSIRSVVLGVFGAVGIASVVQAAPLDFEFTEFTGNNSRLHVQVSQQDANTLLFSLTQPVQAGETQGELRAFYFNLADDSLTGSLNIAGSFISETLQAANAVTQVDGSDTALNGGGVSPFDVGIAFGTTGSDGFVYDTTFTVSYTGGLDLATFFPTGADAQLFGARLKPFSPNGSSKLVCDYPCGNTSSSSSGGPNEEEIPAPASLALLGLGLVGLGFRRRRA